MPRSGHNCGERFAHDVFGKPVGNLNVGQAAFREPGQMADVGGQ
jgi:hypothetical protein